MNKIKRQRHNCGRDVHDCDGALQHLRSLLDGGGQGCYCAVAELVAGLDWAALVAAMHWPPLPLYI